MLLALAGCGRGEGEGVSRSAPAVVAGRVEVDADTPNIAGTPFTLTDQTDKPFSSADLAGKVWMGSIFLANCPGPCFRENQAVAEIVGEITDPDFMAVSLTCDPVNDTPDVLARYAERFEADPARWKFLTGEMQAISDVGLKTFRLPVEVGVHSERGVVFDRRGRLRGGYHLLQPDTVRKLKKLIRDVLAEPIDAAPAPAGDVAGPAAVHPLATTNAVLNSLATVLLVAGWVFIRRGNVGAHRAAMVAAFATSAVFLVCYLAYHWLVGHVPFRGVGPVRTVYFAILISHVLLAAAVPVLALRMFFLAWKGRFDAHRRLGRVTLPIWLYVSVTGVVIYLMLYVLFPGG